MNEPLTWHEARWLAGNLSCPTGTWDRAAFRHFAGDALLDAEAHLLETVAEGHDPFARLPHATSLRSITEQVISELPEGWADAMRTGDGPTVAAVQAVICLRLAEIPQAVSRPVLQCQ